VAASTVANGGTPATQGNASVFGVVFGFGLRGLACGVLRFEDGFLILSKNKGIGNEVRMDW